MAVSDGTYPGNMEPSRHWPGVAPGTRGMNNALSGRYCNLTGLIEVSPRPPILWIRGAEDQIVSDASLFDFGTLGHSASWAWCPGGRATASSPRSPWSPRPEPCSTSTAHEAAPCARKSSLASATRPTSKRLKTSARNSWVSWRAWLRSAGRRRSNFPPKITGEASTAGEVFVRRGMPRGQQGGRSWRGVELFRCGSSKSAARGHLRAGTPR